MKLRYALVAAAAVLLGACSTTPDDPYADERDPFEEVNRDLWDFNQSLDEYVISPAADVYENVPQPNRSGLYNMVENLDEPSSTVNNILQAKFADAGRSVGRFLVNSTVGLLGFFDVATQMGIERRQETFGEVLAVWGVGDGPYIMLPGAGPTVALDGAGSWLDGEYFPFDLLSWPMDIVRYTVKGLELRIRLREQEQVLENSLDSYAFIKETYFQNWRNKVYDDNPPAMDDEFDDSQFDESYDDSFDGDYDDNVDEDAQFDGEYQSPYQGEIRF